MWNEYIFYEIEFMRKATIILFHSDDNNSRLFMQKLAGSGLHTHFTMVDVKTKGVNIPPYIKVVPSIVSTFNGKSTLYAAKEAFLFLDSLINQKNGSQQQQNGQQNRQSTQQKQSQLMASDFDPFVMTGSMSSSFATLTNEGGNIKYTLSDELTPKDNWTQLFKTTFKSIDEKANLGGDDTKGKDSMDKRLQELQSMRDMEIKVPQHK